MESDKSHVQREGDCVEPPRVWSAAHGHEEHRPDHQLMDRVPGPERDPRERRRIGQLPEVPRRPGIRAKRIESLDHCRREKGSRHGEKAERCETCKQECSVGNRSISCHGDQSTDPSGTRQVECHACLWPAPTPRLLRRPLAAEGGEHRVSVGQSIKYRFHLILVDPKPANTKPGSHTIMTAGRGIRYHAGYRGTIIWAADRTSPSAVRITRSKKCIVCGEVTRTPVTT